MLPASILKAIILDPTHIHSPELRLSEAQRTEAILAYSKSHWLKTIFRSKSNTNISEAHGIRNIYYFMIPCCAICFLVTLFFVKGQKSLKREDDERLKEEGKVWAAQNTRFGLDRQKRVLKSGSKLVTVVEVSPNPLDPEKPLQ